MLHVWPQAWLYICLWSVYLFCVARLEYNTNTIFKNVSMWLTKTIFVQCCKWSMQCSFYEYYSNLIFYYMPWALKNTIFMCMNFVNVRQIYSDCNHFIQGHIYTLYSVELKPGVVFASPMFCLSSDWTIQYRFSSPQHLQSAAMAHMRYAGGTQQQ